MKYKNITIRSGHVDDVKNIHELLLKSFEPYKKYYTKDSFNATVLSCDEIKKRINQHDSDILVTILDNQIIGTVSLLKRNQDFLYICSMVVHPDFQRRGIGRLILDNICNIAEKKRIKLLVLESYEPLDKAVKFYKKFGFKRTNKIRDYFGIEIFEMIKDLH